MTTFSFGLGGVSKECSATEVAIRFEVYTADETRNIHFLTFLADCDTGRPAVYNENTFWAEITGGVYIPYTARGKRILSTAHRLMHHLISISLTHQKNNERVPSIDLFFLWTLITSGRHLNLPNCFSCLHGEDGQGASRGYTNFWWALHHTFSSIILVVDERYHEIYGVL